MEPESVLWESLGKGGNPESILEEQGAVVEGYRATRCLYEMCADKGLNPPILNEVYAILYEQNHSRMRCNP